MLQLQKLPFHKKLMHKIYSFYEQPILYSFYDQNGDIYLVNLVDYDDDEHRDIWLYLPISKKELDKLETAKISLGQLMKELKSECFYLVEETDKLAHFQKGKTISELDVSWFPEENVFLI